MKLIRTGSWDRLEVKGAREEVYKALARRFAYRVEGFQFAPAYRSKVWDGRIRLVRKIRNGGLRWPAGLTPEALALMRKKGWEPEVVDDLPPTGPLIETTWGSHTLRPYQVEASEAVVRRGGGIVRLPVRGGKTLVAADVIRRLACRALFVVTSDILRKQALRELRTALPGYRVGTIGAGVWESDADLVVATMQSLAANLKTRQFRSVARGFPLTFFDEVHHLAGDGDAWRDTALAIASRIKVGLSGTVEISRKTQNQSGAIWLRGICGPVVCARTLSELIEAGFIARPTIRFVRHGADYMGRRRYTPAVYKEGVVDCRERNLAIVSAAMRHAREGSRVLIDCSRVGHSRKLVGMIRKAYEGTVGLMLGQGHTPPAERDAILKAWGLGSVEIVVGTIAGEGLDVPELEVVINAEGGKARVSTIQRLRNLTLGDGKKRPVVYEFVDDHDDHLRKWTLARLRIYRGEPAFKIEVDPP